MNKLFVAIAAVFVLAAPAFAAPPETLTFETKNGKVAFSHKAHGEKLGGDCTKCHATKAGGKIEGFSKDSAHKLCQGCHKDGGKGPTKCAECHKK